LRIADSPGNILLLVNEGSDEERLATCLRTQGYQLTIPSAGTLGKSTPEADVEAVIFEAGYEGEDPVQLVQRLRQEYRQGSVPLIALVDGNHMSSLPSLYEAGICCELRVPWGESELSAKLAARLRVARANRELEKELANVSAQHAQLKAEIELAQQVQESFLPPSQLRTENFSLEARLMPGEDLSGDYFDYSLLTPQRLVLFLADVSGHDIASALLANRLKSFFDDHMSNSQHPRLFMEKLNRAILDLGDHQHIATAVCVHISVAEPLVTFASAGHRTMYWLEENGRRIELPASGPALGMFSEFEITEVNRGFTPGCNRLVIYTDGLVEFKRNGDQWVTEEQFRDEVMLPNAGLPIDAYANRLISRSHELTGKQHWDDDVSLLVVDF
jgi:sigma-B regulation protein RsbU (phosphoserine phosphatase)